jgi:hypothetical protein
MDTSISKEMQNPLSSPWSLYAHSASNSSSYKVSYMHVMDVSSCEEWGSMIQHVPGPEVFVRGDAVFQICGRRIISLSFFKDGIIPEWEHPRNKKGSTLTSRANMLSEEMKTLWVNTTCDLARGGIDDAVLGIQFSQKKSRFAPPHVKIDVWLCEGAKVEEIQRLLSQFGLIFTCTPRYHN